MSLLGNIGFGIDRAIGVIAPTTAARRMESRFALAEWERMTRNYDAAREDRFGSGWTPVNKRPDETDSSYRDRIRARARDLERNNGIAQAVLLAMERHVVGIGLQPQALVGGVDGDKIGRAHV